MAESRRSRGEIEFSARVAIPPTFWRNLHEDSWPCFDSTLEITPLSRHDVASTLPRLTWRASFHFFFQFIPITANIFIYAVLTSILIYICYVIVLVMASIIDPACGIPSYEILASSISPLGKYFSLNNNELLYLSVIYNITRVPRNSVY